MSVDCLISPILTAPSEAFEPTLAFEHIGDRLDRLLIRIVPDRQLVEAAVSVAGAKINGRTKGSLTQKHDALPAASQSRPQINAPGESSSSCVDQASAYRKAAER
jgi:hypothetical protein